MPTKYKGCWFNPKYKDQPFDGDYRRIAGKFRFRLESVALKQRSFYFSSWQAAAKKGWVKRK